MKKIIILCGVVLLLAVCAAATFEHTTEKKANSIHPLTRYTLNGYLYDDANTMIRTFGSNQGIYNSQTTVYFNRDVFNNMVTQLNTDDADGFRIYFAKKSDRENTVVILSTFDGGPNPSDKTTEVHRDYFQYSLPVGNIADVNGITHYDNDGGGAKLFLANPQCPVDTCPKGTDSTISHYITCKDANYMVRKFSQRSSTDNINGNSEWFDIDVLKKLNRILQKIPKSGLRIYFATRKDLETDGSGQAYDGFVLIVTTPDDNGVNVDQYVCLPVNVSAKKHHKFGGGGGGTDNGEQCPPNCSGTTWP